MKFTSNQLFAAILDRGLSYESALRSTQKVCPSFTEETAKYICRVRSELASLRTQISNSDSDMLCEFEFETRCEYLDILNEGEEI